MENESIRERLLALKDEEYRDFNSKLVPNVESDKMIGVRIPVLRRYAKEIAGTDMAKEFLDSVHEYYEENCLHALLLENEKDFDKAVESVNKFLPYVDNWAVCDIMCPKVFKKYPEKLYPQCEIWIREKHTYTIRFGLNMLMRVFLDDNFKPEVLELAAGVKSEEYYVNMMSAWFFATALAKRQKETLPYIEGYRLDKWVHNKAIQKAKESRRIDDEMKKRLEGYRL